MTIYGRRRTGKTTLVLEYIRSKKHCLYFQITDPNAEYNLALSDFKKTIQVQTGIDSIMESLSSFKDVFSYFNKIHPEPYLFIIDEFPYLVQKHKSVCGEFQWIIDHGLGANKLILMGSSLSFMKNQIQNSTQPLYGRFDEILEVMPFTFNEIKQLFPNPEDAMQVYAITYGVAQYVMFFLEYESAREAISELLLNGNGRLFHEPSNMLRQELRDIGTYARILRAIGAGEKEPAEIAAKSEVDPKAIYQYLANLEDLAVIEPVHNPLPGKKNKSRRYHTKDLFFRFMYTFIEPNRSLIVQLEDKAFS